jgi:E3 ubiquitin-protein ligase BAH
MKGMETELPGVGLKRLKKMLKKCRSELRSHQDAGSSSDPATGCPAHCSGTLYLSVCLPISLAVNQ